VSREGLALMEELVHNAPSLIGKARTYQKLTENPASEETRNCAALFSAPQSLPS